MKVLMSAWTSYIPATTLNLNVLAFTLAVSLATGLLFGFAPALRISRPTVVDALKGSGRVSGGGARLRSLLVVGEISLALTLLAGAGLMIRSYLTVSRVDLGFDPSNVLRAEISVTGPRYIGRLPEDQRQILPQMDQFFDQVLERASRIQGVHDVALTTRHAHISEFRTDVPEVQSEDGPSVVGVREVSPGYHKTLRIPLVRGRLLDRSDSATSQWVAVVNEEVVRRYFPNTRVIGKHITVTIGTDPEPTTPDRPREIVGVVGDSLMYGPRGRPFPEIYVPYRQHVERFKGGTEMIRTWKALLVRTDPNTPPVLPALRRVIAQSDSELPIDSVQKFDDLLAEGLAYQRFWLYSFLFLGGTGLVLVSVGIFAMTSFNVRARTHEIGIRSALGARPSYILRWVLLRSLKLTCVGLVLGGIMQFCLAKVLPVLGWEFSYYLSGVTPYDPLTLGSVCLFLVLVTVAATWIPARWASTVDPAVALRFE
jgi:predicted permease